MIPKLGKIFVFVNLIAAIGLTAWAVSLTSNRLDWIDKPEGFNPGDENPLANDTNNIERLKNKVTRLNDGIKASQNGLAAKSTILINTETERDFRYASLQARITNARTGKFRTLKYLVNSGLLDLTPNNGEDVLGVDGKPLVGLDAIQQQIKISVDNQSALIKESVRLRKEYETVSDVITKLDEEIERQKVIKSNGEDEAKYLADRSTDWDEQVRTLERRVKQLTDRLTEISTSPKKVDSGKITLNVKP